MVVEVLAAEWPRMGVVPPPPNATETSLRPLSTEVGMDAPPLPLPDALPPDGGGGRRRLQQDVSTIDMLAVYTAVAVTRAGGTNLMLAAIRTAVAKANKAYRDSGITNVQLNLLDARQVGH